ncbi:substrate-binding domain-containing protein [Alienimonas chondri]|uniref:Ribose import binding protein RbsB n=1 Tax=Alienimonas chondri TaxID=2681879 RepID=A0ABX1VBP1_9PLAN|nr:substrate-binding domain-containing protein [Alienimonas chondri]NNJ24920.1 Ribose import binding protein RbsB [Alienimonas chondri]
MTRLPRLAVLPIAALLLGLAVGCSSNDADTSDGPAAAETLKIAVIPKGTTHEFWKSVHAGAQRAAEDLSTPERKIEIEWKGSQEESDTAGQIRVVQNFLTRGVDGIVLAPNDSGGLVDAVAGAAGEGVPVVIFDSALATDAADQGAETVSFVATDNFVGGRQAATRLVEAMEASSGEGKSAVILLRYKAGSESTEQREEGFLAELNENHPDVEILSADQYAGTTPESSLGAATQVLQRFEGEFKGRPAGIFAVCEPNADGVHRALKELSLTDTVSFVGFDPNETLVAGLRDGSVDGIVVQDPVGMGDRAVRTLVAHIDGEEVDARIDTGVSVATPENLDDPAIAALLDPPVAE